MLKVGIPPCFQAPPLPRPPFASLSLPHLTNTLHNWASIHKRSRFHYTKPHKSIIHLLQLDDIEFCNLHLLLLGICLDNRHTDSLIHDCSLLLSLCTVLLSVVVRDVPRLLDIMPED